MDWDNLQNLVSEPCPGNVCGPTVFGPFANFTLPQSAKIYGGEAEVDALVTDKLDASLSLAYAHATFDQYSVPTALAATGQTTANGKTIFGFPPLQATFNATYKDALASTDWDWYVRPEVNYTGRIYVDEVNQSWIPGTFRLNLRAGLEEGSLRFEGYIDNLTDNRTWLGGPARVQQQLHVGRRVGVAGFGLHGPAEAAHLRRSLEIRLWMRAPMPAYNHLIP